MKKGALLLPENETGIFAPWSIAGFDKTTQRRMRIPPDLIYDAFRVTESKIILANLQEFAGLAPCFSSREAALSERLALCLFTSAHRIIGVLIIAESPYLLLGDSFLRLFLTVVTYLASPLLAHSRSARLHKRKDHGYVRKERFLISLKKYAQEIPANGALAFFTINAKTIVAKIRESHPDIDEYRVVQDITAVIATLLSGSPVFVSSNKKKILAVRQAGQIDSALLIHQVSLMIRKLFPEADEIPDIEITENSLPAGEIPDDAIDQFL
ncbi:MAG: hypothetical protein LBQ57_09240 [Spirochaetales bacterium]|nr:hypothetical protein [Spirochaetales bacterium]